MKKTLITIIIVLCTVVCIYAQCEKQYQNKNWGLKACIGSSWYPKVESDQTITFFGDSIYHLKIDLERRTMPYKLEDMLSTKFSRQMSIEKEVRLQQIDSSLHKTFIATYLSKDNILETSYGIKYFDGVILYFQFVKKYDSQYTHVKLIKFINSLSVQSDMINEDLRIDTEKFKKELTKYIFNYDPNSSLTIHQGIWDDIATLSPKDENAEHFDFIAYWQESRKAFCETVSTLNSPEITHFNMSPDSDYKAEGIPLMIYFGELFISHNSGILQSKFTAMKWKGQLYLMNIKIPD